MAPVRLFCGQGSACRHDNGAGRDIGGGGSDDEAGVIDIDRGHRVAIAEADPAPHGPVDQGVDHLLPAAVQVEHAGPDAPDHLADGGPGTQAPVADRIGVGAEADHALHQVPGHRIRGRTVQPVAHPDAVQWPRIGPGQPGQEPTGLHLGPEAEEPGAQEGGRARGEEVQAASVEGHRTPGRRWSARRLDPEGPEPVNGLTLQEEGVRALVHQMIAQFGGSGLATRFAPLLDHRDRPSPVGEPVGDHQAGQSGTDHQHVDVGIHGVLGWGEMGSSVAGPARREERLSAQEAC